MERHDVQWTRGHELELLRRAIHAAARLLRFWSNRKSSEWKKIITKVRWRSDKVAHGTAAARSGETAREKGIWRPSMRKVHLGFSHSNRVILIR